MFTDMTNGPIPHQELFESLGPIDIIATLRQHEQVASVLQARIQAAHRESHQPLRSGNYMIRSDIETGPHIPAQHNRVVFVPQDYHEPVDGIAQLNVRYPITTEDYYPVAPPDSFWNDIFLEVWNEQGESQDYLLNSEGLHAFNNIDDVVPDENFANTRSIFRVVTPALMRVPLSTKTLADIFPPNLQDPYPRPGYIYAHQTTDLEQPYIP
jgi:hypothetical protein